MKEYFAESAFRHGYGAEDFAEVLDNQPMEFRRSRGLRDIYELLGRNDAGDYLHTAFRRKPGKAVVFHMRRMTDSERKMYARRL